MVVEFMIAIEKAEGVRPTTSGGSTPAQCMQDGQCTPCKVSSLTYTRAWNGMKFKAKDLESSLMFCICDKINGNGLYT